MVYLFPYQVRLVFFLVTKIPVSGSADRGVGVGSVRPGFGVGGKMPKTELYREAVGVWNGLGRAEWAETEFSTEPAPSALGAGRERHKSLIRRSSKSWQVGMIASTEEAQTTNTRSSLCGNNTRLLGKNGDAIGKKTDDERGKLLFVCGGEVHHGVEDLNAGVGVDIDAALIWCAGNGG